MDIQIPEGVLTHKPIPVIILVDVSGSMAGPGIQAANEGLCRFVNALKQDEALRDSALLSLITFSDSAKTLVEFEPASAVTAPTLQVECSTMLDQGLDEVIALVGRHKGEMKGAKEPLFCLITDGNPSTDRWKDKLDALNNTDFIGKSPASGRKTGFRLICGAGAEVDKSVLKAFCHDKEKSKLVTIDTVNSLNEFFEYLRTVTVQVSQGRSIPPPDGGNSLVWSGE
jgi:uncharacterized protein YegL